MAKAGGERRRSSTGSWRERTSGGSGSGRDRIVESALSGAGRRPGAPPVRSTGGERLGLRVGDDVVHAKFGEGVVLEIIGQDDKAEAVVRFPAVGEKRLLLAWSPLKRV
jgi:DNA helicase-2/ATP-dependent DNA helicase PcrA